MRTPEEILGRDLLLQLAFEGYEVVPIQQQSLIPAEDGFAEFWAVYPRKTAKPAALKAYRAALKRKVRHETIMAAARKFAASRPDPQYTPHASTWLNQDRFNDEPRPNGSASTLDMLEQDLAERIANGQRGKGSPYPTAIPSFPRR